MVARLWSCYRKPSGRPGGNRRRKKNGGEVSSKRAQILNDESLSGVRCELGPMDSTQRKAEPEGPSRWGRFLITETLTTVAPVKPREGLGTLTSSPTHPLHSLWMWFDG